MKFDDHFIAWVMIYSIAVFLSLLLTSFFALDQGIFRNIIVGLIFAVVSTIMYSILYKSKFNLNKWFIIWTLTFSIIFWLLDLTLKKLNLSYTGFLYFLLFGLLCHLLTYFLKQKVYVRMKNIKAIITILILATLVFFISSFGNALTTNEDEASINSLTGLSIKTFQTKPLIKKTYNSDCPQLDLPLFKSERGGYFIARMRPYSKDQLYAFARDRTENTSLWTNTEVARNYVNDIGLFSGCKGIVSDFSCLPNSTFMDNLGKFMAYYSRRDAQSDFSDPYYGWALRFYVNMFGSYDTGIIVCRLGSNKGENLNYYYCDSGWSRSVNTMPYLTKTLIKKDGTIGETLTISFFNVYDENGSFVRTFCGKSPEEIYSQIFENRIKRELDWLNKMSGS